MFKVSKKCECKLKQTTIYRLTELLEKVKTI